MPEWHPSLISYRKHKIRSFKWDNSWILASTVSGTIYVFNKLYVLLEFSINASFLPVHSQCSWGEKTTRTFLDYLLSTIPAFSSVHLFNGLCLDYSAQWIWIYIHKYIWISLTFLSGESYYVNTLIQKGLNWCRKGPFGLCNRIVNRVIINEISNYSELSSTLRNME